MFHPLPKRNRGNRVRANFITCFSLLIVLTTFNWAMRDDWLSAFSKSRKDAIASKPIFIRAPLPGRDADCGAKSLYLICRVAGVKSDYGTLKAKLQGDGTGASMLQLKNVAIELGFTVSAQHLSFDSLCEHLTKPGSYALLLGGDHFFSATFSGSSRILLADPRLGVEEVDETKLRAGKYQWRGVALLMTRL